MNNSNNELLQEPVSFEDFQFTLEPSLAMSIDFNMLAHPEDYGVSPPLFTDSHTSVLDEQDQRIFTQFLDQFHADADMEPLCDPMPTFDEEQLCESFLLHSIEQEGHLFEESPISVQNDHSIKEANSCLLNNCSRIIDANSGMNTNNANHYGDLAILL